MAVKIGSNISSLQAQSRLTGTGASLDQVFERLSSGQRINRASDDAAGLSISSSLDLSARVFSVSKRNVSDVISALSIADSATEALQSITTRQRELATQASSGTFSSKQREALDAEARELTNEYNRVILTTEFNGRKLFEDPLDTMTAQVGIGEGGTIGYELASELATPMAGGSYFILDGQENQYVWFTMDGKGTNPRPFDTRTYGYLPMGLQVDLVSTPGGGTLDSSVTLEFGAGSSFTQSGSADNMELYLPSTLHQLWFNVNGGNTNSNSGDIQVSINSSWSASQVRDAVVSAINTSFPGEWSLTAQGDSQLVVKELNATAYGVSVYQNGKTSGVKAVSIIQGGAVRGPTPGDVAQAVADAINGQGIWGSAVLGSSTGEVLVSGTNAGGSNSTGDVSTGILSTEVLTPGVGRRDYPVDSTSQDFYWSAYTCGNAKVVDLNNDGAPDVIQPFNYNGGRLGIFLNNGDGTFGVRSDYVCSGLTAALWQSVDTADLNGDGLLDVVANSNTSTISVFINQGDGSLGNQITMTAASLVRGPVALADVNKDGRIDIVAASGTTTASRANVFLNQGNGSFSSRSTYTLPTTVSGQAGVSLADLNGDGYADLVAPLSATGRVAVSLNNGTGGFGTSVTYAVGTTPDVATKLADLNGDGRPDIVQTNTGSLGGAAETVSVLLNNGNGTFGTTSNYTVGDNPKGAATLADLNADGFLDIVQSNSGSRTISVLFGNGSGGFGSKTDYTVGDGALAISPIGAATVADMDGDGTPDIVQTNGNGSGNSTISVLLNTGSGAFGPQTTYAISSTTTSSNVTYATPSVVDLNGDGLKDILQTGTFATNNTFTVLTNQGAGSFASSTLSAKLTFSDARGTAKIQHVDLTTAASAREAMDTLEARADRISRQRAVYGSVESRLKAAASVIDSTIINYRSAESRIKDTDVAEDVASMMRLNILKQVGASVLAQANLEPQIALRLLQGA